MTPQDNNFKRKDTESKNTRKKRRARVFILGTGSTWEASLSSLVQRRGEDIIVGLDVAQGGGLLDTDRDIVLIVLLEVVTVLNRSVFAASAT